MTEESKTGEIRMKTSHKNQTKQLNELKAAVKAYFEAVEAYEKASNTAGKIEGEDTSALYHFKRLREQAVYIQEQLNKVFLSKRERALSRSNLADTYVQLFQAKQRADETKDKKWIAYKEQTAARLQKEAALKTLKELVA